MTTAHVERSLRILCRALDAAAVRYAIDRAGTGSVYLSIDTADEDGLLVRVSGHAPTPDGARNQYGHELSRSIPDLRVEPGQISASEAIVQLSERLGFAAPARARAVLAASATRAANVLQARVDAEHARHRRRLDAAAARRNWIAEQGIAIDTLTPSSRRRWIKRASAALGLSSAP